MIIIAHRGLTNGPDLLLQNNPDQVQLALSLGFDVEIDVWFIEGKYFLGHDTPDYEVKLAWLTTPNLWIHCKNLPAFFHFNDKGSTIYNYFWHETDAVVLTSKSKIWTYMGKPETQHQDSICVMPEITYSWNQIEYFVKNELWGGICTDYPLRIQQCLK